MEGSGTLEDQLDATKVSEEIGSFLTEEKS